MAEALKLNNEESQSSGRSPEPQRPERQMPAWLQRIGDYPKRMRQFLHEVRVEMKLVTWPTVDDVKSTTLVVILTVFFFGFFLFGVDLIVSQGVERVLKAFHK